MRLTILWFACVLFGAARCVHELEPTGNFLEQSHVGGFLNLFGAANADHGQNIIQIQDEGFLIVGEGNGTIAPADGTISNPMITMLNKSGKVVWTKLLPPRGYSGLNTIVEVSLREYVILTYRYPNLLLRKIDELGQITHNKLYEKPGYVYGDRLLQKSHDGGLLLAGEYNRNIGAGPGTFLTKLNAAGSVLWNKEFDSSYGLVRSMAVTQDHGIILIGEKYFEENQNTDLILLKTDQHGGILWSKILGNSDEDERGRSIAPATDGGFVIAGQSANRKLSDYEAFFVKSDNAGNLQWRYTLQTDRYSAANSVVASPDGFFFTGAAGRDILVGKINLQGEAAWTRRINPKSKDGWGNSIIRLRNGKFAVTGSYGEGGGFGGGEFDTFLIVVDSNGNFVTRL